ELFTRVDMADTLSTRPIQFSDDGAELYWLDARGPDKAPLVAQDLASGALRTLGGDPLAACVGLEGRPVSLRPIAAAAAFARQRWHVTDPAYSADHAALAAEPGDLSVVGISDDERHWVAYYERDAAPGRYVHYDRASRQRRLLFTSRRALESAPLVPMEP